MNELEPKLVGEDRTIAISELRSSLLDSMTGLDTPIVSPEERLLHSLTLHPDKEKYLDVFTKLFLPISLNRNAFVSDPYSPTPGDPRRAMMDGSPYTDEALLYMFEKVTLLKNALERGARFGRSDVLLEDEINTIRREISMQHEHEVEKNAAAFDRFREKFMNEPESVAQDEADLSERIRGVNATSSERLRLLAQHPEIDAIEDMKCTCVMDYVAYVEAMSAYRNRLWALNDEERFTVILVPTVEQSPRPRDIGSDVPDQVRADKTVIAEIYDSQTGLVFEAVEKTNWYAFETSRIFEGVLPHIVNGMNEQPIYTQVCIRLKRNRISEDELRERERQYDIQQFYIRKDKKRVYEEDL